MKEDNIEIFDAFQKDRRLYDFVINCMTSILMSCDGGRRSKKTPGAAVEQYLNRMEPSEANWYRENLQAKHFDAYWSQYGRELVEMSINDNNPILQAKKSVKAKSSR